MKNQYFLKDKKVKLVTQTTGRDNWGNSTKIFKYLTDESLWAYTSQLSQSETFSASQYGNNEVRMFVLNFRNDLKLSDFVEYKNKYYSITRLDTKDDYNGELFVYVRDATTAEAPKNIQPATSSQS